MLTKLQKDRVGTALPRRTVQAQGVSPLAGHSTTWAARKITRTQTVPDHHGEQNTRWLEQKEGPYRQEARWAPGRVQSVMGLHGKILVVGGL